MLCPLCVLYTLINTDVCYCHPQDNDLVNITECDLRLHIGPFFRGPGRLATHSLLSPLPGFEAIQGLQPFLSLSTRVSSSEVFLVDDLLVVFTGFFNGQVRKVRIGAYRVMHPLCAEREWYTSLLL